MSGPRKIAVLDDYQDLSRPIFATLDPASYEVTVFNDTLLPYNHASTPQDEKDKLVARLERFDIICTMRERTPFPAPLLARLPQLKLLLTTGTRNAALDLPALRARGIPVAGAVDAGKADAGAGTDSTTEHCVALVLAAARGLAADDAAVKAGGWQTAPAVGLAGRTFAAAGLGRLGAAVARVMHVAFGMRVVAWSANLTQEAADGRAEALGLPPGTFRVVGKEELFREADVLSVHLVLSDRSRGVIGARELEVMKAEAIFVNTSRGPLVVEEALMAVLEKGAIRAAALDVFDLEPLPLDSKWRTTSWGRDGRSQVLLTPHMGYVEKSTLQGWYEHQVDNITRWEKGEALWHPL
ncbi:hypothetical protein P8C59_008292 [Phyllachora maydis]|uniref:D-isomer specific 2-hydroxyacid dehydrogenase n=1 Tax=Phyllachora maydis TaxID=1825666 RepID=A0AAD9MGM3_9PEZI|nr:hypothetical protein P8C59_008292 [Phyllachora maydis]